MDNGSIGSNGRLGAEGDVLAAIKEAVDEAIIAFCVDQAIVLTAEYLKIRKQFGQPLANFQSLQHGVANLGTTTEYAIGHHLQRVLVAEQMFGNGAHHFERFLSEPG